LLTEILPPDTHHIYLAAFGAPTLRIPVGFADEASKLLRLYRDRYSLGASAFKPGCGHIHNSRNLFVGRISYNGRIWNHRGDLIG
jgi:hypothetical protein